MDRHTPRPASGPAPSRRTSSWRRYLYEVIAREISTLARYADRVVQCAPLPFDHGVLLEAIVAPAKLTAAAVDAVPAADHDLDRTIVLLNGTFNYSTDIQQLLLDLAPKLRRGSRLVSVVYNPYLQWLYRLANRLGLRQGSPPSTFLTRPDLDDVAALAGYEVVRNRPVGHFPFRLFGLGSLVNSFCAAVPLLRWTALVSVVVLRRRLPARPLPSLSIVIPARNEKGNIEAALQRLPDLPGARLEVIFVEGHSTDGTWEEIQRVLPLYRHRFPIQAHRQTGKGKSDAVRLGFAMATGDLLTILDADLTMPPELLHRFYDAWCDGRADFVNGSRLAYPMEGQAMRFLNQLGNAFFAKALSFVLDVRLSDTLCGTKLLARRDWERFVAWRRDFGDFDPFGDFELLFPAAILGLGTVNLPIAYRARTYGSTNIRRFRHGLMLLRMTFVGLFRVRAGRLR
jgi:hypothetical protein